MVLTLFASQNHLPLKFTYDDYFTAVATTDILCNISDVLACKPSELAFYPIPKLMIRRVSFFLALCYVSTHWQQLIYFLTHLLSIKVGDHEAYSALRASELGDGTLEVRTVPLAVKYVELFLSSNLLEVMNNSIVNNNKIGLYDGCKNAVRIALERANRK